MHPLLLQSYRGLGAGRVNVSRDGRGAVVGGGGDDGGDGEVVSGATQSAWTLTCSPTAPLVMFVVPLRNSRRVRGHSTVTNPGYRFDPWGFCHWPLGGKWSVMPP